MASGFDSLLTQVRDNKARIFALISEAESIRSRLGDVCDASNCSVVSTRLPSGAVTAVASPAPTITPYDLNSPAASTIYMGSSRYGRSMRRDSMHVSRELEAILPSVSSSVHRKALIAIDRHGMHAVKWRNGFTALHWACRVGNARVCNYLLSRGADPNARDSTGRLPSDYGTITDPNATGLFESVDIASLPEPQRRALEAMERHGWRSLKWGGGWTILHWAYQHNRADVIDYCKNAGMPIDIKDDKGLTPSHYAPS